MIEYIAPFCFTVSTISLALLLKEDAELALAKLIGYKVIGVGFKKSHFTLSKAEAMQWMGCYNEALLFKGKTFIGSRKAL